MKYPSNGRAQCVHAYGLVFVGCGEYKEKETRGRRDKQQPHVDKSRVGDWLSCECLELLLFSFFFIIIIFVLFLPSFFANVQYKKTRSVLFITLLMQLWLSYVRPADAIVGKSAVWLQNSAYVRDINVLSISDTDKSTNSHQYVRSFLELIGLENNAEKNSAEYLWRKCKNFRIPWVYGRRLTFQMKCKWFFVLVTPNN